MEYLLTYGWAVLAVMVIGVAFWRLGLLSENDQFLSSVGFTYFKLIEPSSETVDGLQILRFVNTRGVTITFNTSKSTVKNGDGVDCPNILIRPETVPPDGQFEIDVMNLLHQPPCIPPTQDDYKLDFNLAYDASLGGQKISQTESGTVKGRQKHPNQETCTKTDNPSNPVTANYYKQGITCAPHGAGCYIDHCDNPSGKPSTTGKMHEYTCPPTIGPAPPTPVYQIINLVENCANGVTTT